MNIVEISKLPNAGPRNTSLTNMTQLTVILTTSLMKETLKKKLKLTDRKSSPTSRTNPNVAKEAVKPTTVPYNRT